MINSNFSLNKLEQTFVIAEAGSNWKCGTYEEDLDQAVKLIEIAAKCGADAVKFQTYKAETVYVENAGSSNYLSKYGINDNINKIFENLSMPYEMIPELQKKCMDNNIMFMSTPFSVKDAEQVDPFVEIHKIASFEINHIRLIEFLAETKKPIIISTGASTYEEIEFAVNLIRKKGNENIALLQCTSKYPCSIESLNLAVIPKIHEKFNVPIGLSDHSINPIIGPVTATAIGARIIEKHFTLDRNLPGPDHPFALIPDELKKMIDAIRDTERAIGSSAKRILDEEVELRNFAKRSIQAITDIKRGEILKEGKNFDILRSGNKKRGMEPRFISKIEGKKSEREFKKGEGVFLDE